MTLCMTLYEAARCGKTKCSIVNAAACVQFVLVYSLYGSVHAVHHETLWVITPFYGLWWSVKHISAQPDSSGPHNTFIEGRCPEPMQTADTLRELRDEADILFKHPRTANQHRPRSTQRRKENVQQHGASFLATRSMRLEADWGMKGPLTHSWAHG